MKLVAALTVLLLCVSCQGQVFVDYDEGIGNVVHMIKNTIEMLYDQKEKMISLEEHLKNLTSSQEDQNQQIRDDLSNQNRKMISLEEHLKNLTSSQEDQNQQIRDDLSDHTTKLSVIEDQNQLIREDLSAQSIKIVSLEEQLMVSSTSHEETLRTGLENMTDNFLNSSAIKHNELLPSLQKCSGFLDFIENQNECIDGSHRCSEFAQCIDEGLSYRCQCQKGYSGDGFQCHVNCRDSFGGEFLEDLGCVTLVKTPMTWEASKNNCLQKGMRLLEDIPSRQHFRLISNAFKFYTHVMWVGAKGRSWLTTGEDIDSDLYMSYNNEPNGGLEECLYFYSRPEADQYEGLADASCTNTYYSFCQFLLPLPSQ